MFGLGVGELLLLLAVVALVGGPSAIKSVVRAARTVSRVKSDLSGKVLLDKVLDLDERPRRRDDRR